MKFNDLPEFSLLRTCCCCCGLQRKRGQLKMDYCDPKKQNVLPNTANFVSAQTMEPAYLSRFVKGATLGSSVNREILAGNSKSSLELTDDAKKFYEDVVGLHDTDRSPNVSKNGTCPVEVEEGEPDIRKCICKHSSCNTKSELTNSRDNKLCRRQVPKMASKTSKVFQNDLFRSAALGHTLKVQDVISRCGSHVVNDRDKYEWTLLMTAASKGQEGMVSFLLEHGADTTAVDLAGNDARLIALKARHYKVADLIERFVDGSCEQRSQVDVGKEDTNLSDESDSGSSVFCEACKTEYDKSEEKIHMSSTVHLYNYNKNRKIPDHNAPVDSVGYQMMLRSGWEHGQGLGPGGKGGTELVATVLKTDRSGVGSGKQKKRVTHFQSFDDSAVKAVGHKDLIRAPGSKMLRKRERLKEHRRSKQWEINLRSYMNQP